MADDPKAPFADLGLTEPLLSAVADVGYTKPTPIQESAIPVVLMGRDVLGCAQTGTGKTASFTLPMIEILSQGRARARMPRSLIVEPTRELAAQVADNFINYGRNHKLSMALLIGGVSFDEQEEALDRGVDVLIATPGRLLDHFGRGKVLLNDVKILVIDEADRMLDMGFIPDVERIATLLPRIRQTLFFSATMPAEIRRLAGRFLMNAKEISVAPPASPAETVTQCLLVVTAEDKREALRTLISQVDLKNALVFCNRKRDVGVVFRALKKAGFAAAELHGDMSQPARMETLDKFRKDEATILVASDVAARGLDIAFLSHVINFDVPVHAEDYIHRIGRTGRAGREGISYTLATPDDTLALRAIETLIGREIPRIEFNGIEQVDLAEPEGRGRRGRARRKEPTAAEPRSGSRKDAAGTEPRGSRRRKAKSEPATETVEALPETVETGPVQDAPVAQAEPVRAEAESVRKAPRRGRRQEQRETPAEPAQQASREPATETKAPAPAEKPPSRERPSPRRGGRTRERSEAADEPMGLGDDVPAFLLRSLKLPSSSA